MESRVTDRGETFQYLDRLDDDAYSPIDVDRAQAICRRHGVELDDGDDELYPTVVHVVAGGPVRAAIDAVSAAVDHLFSAARNRDPDHPRA
jgi:hypothetical protein